MGGLRRARNGELYNARLGKLDAGCPQPFGPQRPCSEWFRSGHSSSGTISVGRRPRLDLACSGCKTWYQRSRSPRDAHTEPKAGTHAEPKAEGSTRGLDIGLPASCGVLPLWGCLGVSRVMKSHTRSDNEALWLEVLGFGWLGLFDRPGWTADQSPPNPG